MAKRLALEEWIPIKDNTVSCKYIIVRVEDDTRLEQFQSKMGEHGDHLLKMLNRNKSSYI